MLPGIYWIRVYMYFPNPFFISPGTHITTGTVVAFIPHAHSFNLDFKVFILWQSFSLSGSLSSVIVITIIIILWEWAYCLQNELPSCSVSHL